VAAKVYYQLQEYNESMIFALGAGKLFRLDHQGEFEETIVGMYLIQSDHRPPN
jgi:26S proteasome regulatory subunit N2